MIRYFFFLLLLLLSACARSPQPVWTELPQAESLLQRVSATTGQVRSLDGAASVGLTLKGKYFSSQQFLLAEKPDHLRTDVLTGFGQLVLQLTSDGEDLAVFMHTTTPGRFFRGPASAENLSRFTRIPLPAKDMVRLLLYDPPLIGAEQREVLVEKGTLLLRLSNLDMQQDLLFDEQLKLTGCRYFLNDQLWMEVLYQKFTEQSRFPQTIRINLPAEETQAVIKFSELQTNLEIPTERFRLKKPIKIPVEALP